MRKGLYQTWVQVPVLVMGIFDGHWLNHGRPLDFWQDFPIGFVEFSSQIVHWCPVVLRSGPFRPSDTFFRRVSGRLDAGIPAFLPFQARNHLFG
jgi:hypothetical protein